MNNDFLEQREQSQSLLGLCRVATELMRSIIMNNE